jgi:prepilin-type N-terminal cleavage/methylation domain-containing protein
MRDGRGFSMLELLAVLAILGLVVTITAPDLFAVRRSVNLSRLAKQIASDTTICRVEALTTCRNVGLVFYEEGGRWLYRMVADGNRNGVSRREVATGQDRALGPRVWLEFLSAGTRVGVPPGWQVPDPSGSGTLPADGLRIGSADIISFSARGTATPCSVYFNDGFSRMLAVRVNGEVGRIRALEWRRGWPRWREVPL